MTLLFGANRSRRRERLAHPLRLRVLPRGDDGSYPLGPGREIRASDFIGDHPDTVSGKGDAPVTRPGCGGVSGVAVDLDQSTAVTDLAVRDFVEIVGGRGRFAVDEKCAGASVPSPHDDPVETGGTV